jgi:hypothetical protein
METVTVNKETLQKLLDYVSESEALDYDECVAMEWSELELEKHAYSLIMELQNIINAD